MPTQTFFNLQEDKQNKILDASKKEFREYGFYDASINRIIKEAGISRGSFYQYFDNKEDLFLYITDQFKKVIIELISMKINLKKCDIFDLYLLIFDILTKESFPEEDKAFIVTTTSNINMKLINHLLDFSLQKDFNDDLDEINKLVDISNIKYATNKELKNIYGVLMNMTMFQIVTAFSNPSTYEKCRSDLMSQFQLIKHGISK